MKINKIITALLILNSFSPCVGAQMTANIDTDNQKIVIDVREETPQTYLSLRIENEDGEYFLLKQFKTDADGKYTGTYPLKMNSGDYILKLHINGGETLKKPFYFTNADDLKIFFSDVVSKLDTATSENYTDLKTAIEGNRKYMADVDFVKYDEIMTAYADNDVYSYILKQEKPSNVGTLSSTVNQALAMKEIKEEKTADTLKQNAEVLGISENEVYTFFETLTADGQQAVATGVANMYDSVAAFETAFAQNTLIKGIAEKNYREYDSVINTCKNCINTQLFTRYTNLSEVKKTDVQKALAGKVFTDYTAFETAFSQAIASAELVVVYPSGGSSGGGSSGGGGSSKKNSSSVITGVPVISKPEPEPEIKVEFADMDTVEWAKEAVSVLAEKKIVFGKSDTEFCPSDRITREEFLALILRGFKIETKGNTTDFEDVTTDAWYYDTVATAQKLGIVSGIDENNFGSGKNITRQEMCVIAHRAATMKNVSFKTAETIPFEDGIALWAEDAVSDLYASGIVSGVGEREFMAEYTATRAEASVLIYKLLGFADIL